MEVGVGHFGTFGGGGGSSDDCDDRTHKAAPVASPCKMTAKAPECPKDNLLFPINEIKVDSVINKLTRKADCVYKKMEKNSVLSKTMEKFMGEKTPVHLILDQKSNLRVKDNDPGSPLVNGKTEYGTSFYITILLNTEQANNRPSLAVARTILHEAIHAEIYRKIKTRAPLVYNATTKTWNLSNGSRADFPTLFDSYDEDPKNPDHNYMAGYYRSGIETGLKEYAKAIGEKHSDQFYKDMAWSGLFGTKSWEKQYKDQAFADKEKKRIIKTISDYEKSGNNECK